MWIKSGKKIAALIALTAFVMTVGCGKKEEDEDDEASTEEERAQILANGNSSSPDSDPVVPQVGAINLEGLATAESSSLRLQDDDDDDDSKCRQDELGIFGLALGGACHTSGFASQIMLGSDTGDHNEDGVLNCDDHVEDGDTGIMLGLMCGDIFQKFEGLQSFSFNDKEEKEFMGLSFADFDAEDDVTATGAWSKGNAASYPANIRFWQSETSFAALEGIFAFNLASLEEGTIMVDFKDDDEDDIAINAATEFKNNSATKANCAADPTEENCVYQEVKIYNPDDTRTTNSPPNGMHIRIMTDDKLNPTFYHLEGLYQYNEEKAAELANAGLAATRQIYFKTIQQDGEIWGSFEFRDENDALLSVMHGSVDVIAQLADGVCKTLATGEDTECGAIDPDDFTFVGRAAMDTLATTPVDADFETGKPTKAELCLADVEECIDLSDVD
jgi:hypothetical protein